MRKKAAVKSEHSLDTTQHRSVMLAVFRMVAGSRRLRRSRSSFTEAASESLPKREVLQPSLHRSPRRLRRSRARIHRCKKRHSFTRDGNVSSTRTHQHRVHFMCAGSRSLKRSHTSAHMLHSPCTIIGIASVPCAPIRDVSNVRVFLHGGRK